MKNFVKAFTVAVLTTAIALPALAGELTKGTKSYQKRDTADQVAAQQTPDAQQPMSADEAANMAPAAGGMEEPAADKGKSFKEEIRLPRKN